MPESSNQEKQPAELLPKLRRGYIDQLTIYEISDSELEILARGSPNSLYLNFSLSLLSAAISFTIALLTTTIPSDRVFAVFVAVALVGYVIGLLFLLLWYKTRESVSGLVQRIKNRLPPEGIKVDQVAPDDSTATDI